MKRLVVSLVLDEQGAWVTHQYRRKTYLGEPSNIIRILNEMKADEVALSWLGVSERERNQTLALISSQASMPLSYAGGISSADQALEVLRMGYEKITLTSAILEDPEVLSRTTRKIGRSSVVVRFPVRMVRENLRIWDWRRARPSPLDLSEALSMLEPRYASEAIISSVDDNGTRCGYNSEIVEELISRVEVLRGYEGGVANQSQIIDLWNKGIDAVYSGSFIATFGPFHAALPLYPQFFEERYR